MKHLLIVGAGGLARETYWLALEATGYNKEWDIKGFLDGDVRLDDKEYDKLPLPVLGNVNDYVIRPDDVFVCAIGAPRIRERICGILEVREAKFVNVISSRARISQTAILGHGNIICGNVGISCDTMLGNHVFINAQSTMGHDSEVGDFSVISSHCNITGRVKVGRGTFWGSGSRALPGSKIGDYAYIGAGSVVLRKVKANTKVFGIPALEI